MTASASFTFALDNVENPLTEPFEPRKRWTCWSSGKREDWYAIDFGTPRTLTGFDLYFFDDAPSGECRPPAIVRGAVRSTDDRSRHAVPGSPVKPTKVVPRTAQGRGEPDPVRARRVHAGSDWSSTTRDSGSIPVSMASSRSTQDQKDASPPPSPLQFTADKFITADDILVSVIRVHNPTDRVQTIYVDPIIQPADDLRVRVGRQRLGADRRSRTARSRAASRGRSRSTGGRNCTASRSTAGSATRCWTIPRAR